MKRKLFLIEQIVEVLKQVELGQPVADLIRKVGISEQTFYCWKRQYAELGTDQIREFTQLFEENARLKKLLVDLSLDNAVLEEDLSKNVWSAQGSASL
jgi:putative transposase